MRPLRLTLKGFTSFREQQTIDFAGLEVFAIAGPTGSGKSSILDAMTYALYGQIDRVGNQCGQLVSQGLPRMAVTLDFRVGSDDYRITRTTPTQGASRVALERFVDGEPQSYGEGADRARDVKELVAKIVGLDYDAFTRSVLLPQNKFAEFLTGEPKKRRDILIELLGLSLFNDMGRRAGQIGRDARLQADDRAAVLEREYEGVDEQALAAAQAKAAEAATRQAQIEKAVEQVRTLAGRAEEDQRSSVALADASGEASAMASSAKAATEAIAGLGKRIITADSAVDKRETESDSRAGELKAVLAARIAAEKKWGTISTLSAAKGRADDLPRLRKAQQTAETALARASARRPRALEGEKAAVAKVADADAGIRETAKQLRGARDELQKAEHQDHVATLLVGRKKGDPCPVCGEPLRSLPKRTDAGLRAARSAMQAAEVANEEARDTLTDAKLALQAAQNDLQQLAGEVEQRTEQAADAKQSVKSAEREITKVLGVALADDVGGELIKRIKEVERLVEGEAEARDLAMRAERVLGEERQKRASLDAEVASERARLEVKVDALYGRCVRLGVAATRLPKVAPLPGTSKGVEALVTAGRDLTTTLSTLAAHLAEQAGLHRKTEKGLLAEALRSAQGIVDGAEALPALLSAVVSAERTALRDATAAKQSADALAKRLKNRRDMENEVETLKLRAHAFGTLALELRADHMIAFLQAEALQAMAAAASVHLAELSDQRYTLVCRDDDEFFVVDRWTGDELRSVRTLSGGETFIASLALALGLAERVRALSIAGRARLDSLFLDEGFGSLDPDTLEVSTDAIQRLAGDGRLVGVITHLRDLTEQFTRIEVEKTPRGSTLRFVAWPRPPVTSVSTGGGVSL